MATNITLIELLQKATPHKIVKLLYHCEITGDYSEQNQIKYLQS